MRKPDKSAIMSVPVGPDMATQEDADASIQELASRLNKASQSYDRTPALKEIPKAVSLPFIPEVPRASIESESEPKGQMSLTGPISSLNALKALSKEEKNTHAEMVDAMRVIYEQLKVLGKAQRYSPEEMFEILLHLYEYRST